jgi:hypothetical protein
LANVAATHLPAARRRGMLMGMVRPIARLLSMLTPKRRWAQFSLATGIITMTRHLVSFIGLGILSVVSAGCQDHNHYEIELTPDGPALDRQLTCWRERHEKKETILLNFFEEELGALETVYGKPSEQPEPRHHRFSGRFEGKTPADIGGSGSYTLFPTAMGSTAAYVERFRGNDDVAAQLDDRRKAIDRLAELVIGWFESQMGKDENWPRVRKFLDGEFRKDLHNLDVYLWTASATTAANTRMTDDPFLKAGSEFVFRAGQYLVDRGYFEPAEVFDIARLIPDLSNGDGDGRRLLALVRKLLVKKVTGRADDKPMAASLRFLVDVKRASDSWDQFLRKTPEFMKQQREFESNKKQSPEIRPPDGNSVIVEILVERIVSLESFIAHPDEVKVTLFTSQKPFSTNGEWESGGNHVTWSLSIDSGRSLPTVCYAAWSTPEEKYQTRHFGKVVLTGEDLSDYVTWYLLLDVDDAAEWNKFVAELRPGPELKPKLEAFVFARDRDHKLDSDAENSTSPKAMLADTPRKMILAALDEPPATEHR